MYFRQEEPRGRRVSGNLDSVSRTPGAPSSRGPSGSEFLAGLGPAEAGRHGRLIILTLDQVLRGALIEAEYGVVQIQPVHDEGEPTAQPNAALRIHLEVRIKIDVAQGAVDPAGRAVRVLVPIDARLVVGHSHTDGEAAPVVGGADVEGIWRCPEQPRMVGPARNTVRAGRRESVVRTAPA